MVRGRTEPGELVSDEPQDEFEPETQELQEQGTPVSDEAQEQENPPAQAAAPEKPVDLAPFKKAVLEAVEQRDQSTGNLPVVALEAVKTEYRKLEGRKAKQQAKQVLADGMKAGMDAIDIQTARAYDSLMRDAAVGTAAKQDKVPTDPTEQHVNLVTTLDLARTMEAPDGVASDWQDRVNKLYAELAPQLAKYRTWVSADQATRGDEPKVSDLVRTAVRLQSGKKVKTGKSDKQRAPFTGVRREIATHISSAFENVPVGGFLSVADIVNHKSAEYGSDAPSPGAVLARLYPKSGKVTLVGVVPATNEKGTRGARKTA